MERNKDIQKELTEISPLLAGLNPVNVFTVPEGYFNGFSNECLLLLQVLPALPQTSHPQRVPEGYFDNLAENILSKIKLTDTDLPVFGKVEHPFKVPSAYFETLASVIVQQIQPAKLVRMKSSFFRYAAAAVITGFLGLSLFNQLDKKESIEPAVVSYATNEMPVKEDAIDKALESINDEEIVDYLSTRGQDVNASLVASVMDENNLPASEDYLLDENTLKEFLIENNIRHFN